MMNTPPLPSFHGDSTRERQDSWLMWGAVGAASGLLGYWAYKSLISQRQRNCDDKPPVHFEAYLKVPAENPSLVAHQRKQQRKTPAPTDFESYLKNPDPRSVTHTFNSNETSDDETSPPPHMKPVAVLYGTEFGLSREVAETLSDKLLKTGAFWPLVLSMDDYPQGLELGKFQALFVTCSTQGEGVPPTDARPFCSWLHSDAAPSLNSTVFSVCALGDTSYTHFARCGKEVDARLEALGANRVAPRVDVNKEDWNAIHGWIESVLSTLESQNLKTVAEMDVGYKPAAEKSVDLSGYSKSRPYLAQISHVSSLCTRTGHDDKNTVRVDIDLGDSGLEYVPGDSLGVWPTNDPSAVDEILHATGWDGDMKLKRPSWHYKDPRMGDTNLMSLRDLLLYCYDLKSPKPDILEVLAEQGNLPEALKASIGNVEGRNAYMKDRHLIDLLEECSPGKQNWISAEQVAKYLRQLVPRLYSISSSPLENPTSVTLTVAVVEYEMLKKDRIGVCSTFLANRVEEGGSLPVYLYSNPDFRLPEDGGKPIVMVGPGTGVAPFRAFLQQRIQEKSPGKNVLFFGCRRRTQDFLYGNELESMEEQGNLTLFTAFSRETEQKVYVQNRMHEQGDLVWQLLEEGGHFYICGDGEHMASAVEAQLVGIVEKKQGQGKEAAETFVKSLIDAKRLQKDVWVS